jgi:hypothetical protein
MSMNELKPPNAHFFGGDRVLRCSACNGEHLQYQRKGDEIVFICNDCKPGRFALNIEQRDGRVCFMWHWLNKGE